VPINVIHKTTDIRAIEWWENKQREVNIYVAAIEAWKAEVLPQFPKSRKPEGRTIVVDNYGVIGVSIESSDYAKDIPFAWQRKDKMKMYIPRTNKPEGAEALKRMTAFQKPTTEGSDAIGIPYALRIDDHIVTPGFELIPGVLYSLHEVHTTHGAMLTKREVEKTANKAEIAWVPISITEWLEELEVARVGPKEPLASSHASSIDGRA
jgi:hypothetical protein